jgi:hypothetical protein
MQNETARHHTRSKANSTTKEEISNNEFQKTIVKMINNLKKVTKKLVFDLKENVNKQLNELKENINR